MWHPNIDKEGKVCISILHEPGESKQPTKLNFLSEKNTAAGDDRFGYEKASERWLPIHTVETILISG